MEQEGYPPSLGASNRTILEWKYLGHAVADQQIVPSNRTILEWKQIKLHLPLKGILPSNRTILEWKQINGVKQVIE